MTAWENEGLNVQWYVLMVDAPTGQAAKPWKDEYGLEHPHVLGDPGYEMLPPGTGSFGTPMFTVVDPRTMTVVHTQQGAGGHDQKIEQLAKEVKAAADAVEPEI